jgi:hypothetical protein
MEDKKSVSFEEDTTTAETSDWDMTSTVESQLRGLSAQDWREEAIDHYLNCYLCGGKLNFSNRTDFAELTVQEESHCVHCQIRSKQQVHRLQ